MYYPFLLVLIRVLSPEQNASGKEESEKKSNDDKRGQTRK